ncbi:restriction endonuclease subunit S [Myroides sp. LJL119]
MEQEHTLHPKLRFPEFKGMLKNVYLKDIAKFSKGKNISKADIVEDGLFECIRYGELYTTYNEVINKIVSKTNLDETNLVFSEANDIIIPASGESALDIATASCVIKDNIALGGDLNIIKTKENGVFLAYYFNNKKKYDIAKKSQGISVIHIYSDHLKSLYLNLPSLPEQQKIADYLFTIDNKINLLEEKKEQLTLYKKGLMQKLFSQEIRFKDEKGNAFLEWNSFQLKDILLEHKEKNKGNKYTEVVSVAKEKGVINQIEHLGRSYSSENIEHYKVVNPYDIVYTKSPTSGFPFGIIKQNKLNRSAVLSPLYAVFKPKTIYLGMLLHDLFLSEVETFNYLVPLVQKGAKNTMNINNEDFLNGKKYMLPTSEKEQQKIADFLSFIDDSIDKVNEQISQTQNFKKAMLQQMFV